jgi:DNA-binding phage protein
LGHLLPPYREHEAAREIPAPTLSEQDKDRSLKFTAIGVDRWQYDVWYQIIMAELEGHPDQVDLSVLNHLDRKAASRYSASTSQLLRWFGRHNAGKPYADKVKAFNFMLAYQFSRTAFNEAVADGEFDVDLFEGGPPAVVAPYDSDPERALAKCFDRRTGKPVPISVLASYREVLANYHLHSESKFHNGELYDRGVTERMHVEVIAVDYIGKEANRWEEQYFLGEMPEAQIEYGLHPEGHQQLIAILSDAAKGHGMGALAEKAGLSRQQLHAILFCGAQPKRGTITGLCKAIRLLSLPSRA